jgi:hypothetical protein
MINTLNWNHFALSDWNSFTVTGWDFFVIDGEYSDPYDYFVEAVEAYVPFSLKNVFQPVQARSVFRAGKVVSSSRQ